MHPNDLSVLNTSPMPKILSSLHLLILSITLFCEIVATQGVPSESTYDFAQVTWIISDKPGLWLRQPGLGAQHCALIEETDFF